MTSFWWVDRTLPGITATTIWAAALFVSHRLLKRHITRVTQRQNEHIEQLTDRQTVQLAGGGKENS